MDRRRLLAGFALAGLVLVVFLGSFGFEAVLSTLRAANPVAYAAAPVAALAVVSLTAASLSRLCRRVEGAPRGVAFAGGYATGMLLRGLAPWGRSGGSLLTAAALDRRGESRFEELLGACVTEEFLSAVGGVNVAVVGVVTLLATGGGGSRAGAVAVVLAGFVAVLALLVVLVLGYPRLVVGAVTALLAAVRGTVGRAWPRADGLLARADLPARTAGLLDSLRAMARDPRTVGPAFAMSQLASLGTVVPLWASLRAVEEPVAFAALMVVVPLTGVAAVVPLPGGTGGVEFALGGALVAAVGVSPPGAAAAVLLYRLATYWLSLTVGGVGTVLLGGATRADPITR